jgi:hypothetical protein
VHISGTNQGFLSGGPRTLAFLVSDLSTCTRVGSYFADNWSSVELQYFNDIRYASAGCVIDQTLIEWSCLQLGSNYQKVWLNDVSTGLGRHDHLLSPHMITCYLPRTGQHGQEINPKGLELVPGVDFSYFRGIDGIVTSFAAYLGLAYR